MITPTNGMCGSCMLLICFPYLLAESTFAELWPILGCLGSQASASIDPPTFGTFAYALKLAPKKTSPPSIERPTFGHGLAAGNLYQTVPTTVSGLLDYFGNDGANFVLGPPTRATLATIDPTPARLCFAEGYDVSWYIAARPDDYAC